MQTKEETPEERLHKQPTFRKIILFNGPPRCGKSFGADHIASYIRKHAPWMYPQVFDFAEPLKKAAHALYDVFHGWDYYDREGAPQKSLSSGDFLGLSPREAYIAMSDKLKELHGEEVLGFIMRKRIIRNNQCQCVIIPNNGFVDELKPLVDLVGQRSILVIEVHAANKTFEGDSRGWVGDKIKERWEHVEVRKIPNVFGTQEDKDFYRLLLEGCTKKFLKLEEKEDA